MPAKRSALVPFFKALKHVLGSHADTTKISDIDVILNPEGEMPIDFTQVRNGIAAFDKSFTINLEKICGVTYCDPVSKDIIPIDIINKGVFMPLGIFLGQLGMTDIPWPKADEVIKMKTLSAREREDDNKMLRDLDDIKALLIKFNVPMTYNDDTEKATFKAALEASLEDTLPQYLKLKTEWSAEEWMARLNLA
ncbi:hypothetical protein EDB85DRAFT_2133245 [Lactarius pseudohatsudake]|nr:hypothetical protein EDB85DRAFT_2133245 [Lactarius pseudohatsudake]